MWSGNTYSFNLRKSTSYRMIFRKYASNQVVDNEYLEYLVTCGTQNISVTKINTIGTLQEPTITKDNDNNTLTVTAPTGAYYYYTFREI